MLCEKNGDAGDGFFVDAREGQCHVGARVETDLRLGPFDGVREHTKAEAIRRGDEFAVPIDREKWKSPLSSERVVGASRRVVGAGTSPRGYWK